MKSALRVLAVCFFSLLVTAPAFADSLLFQMDVSAADRYERTDLADAGATFLTIREDSATVLGDMETYKAIVEMGYDIQAIAAITDFPSADAAYHNWDETIDALNQAEADYPAICAVESIGQSIEGRDLWAIKISDNVGVDEGEPVVLFVALHHAREHLTVEVALGIVSDLTENYGTDSEVTELVNANEIWVVPQLNPDGGEYDIQSGSYAMWRKNRRDNGSTYGVDLNRNYSTYWGGSGSSGLPSSETYRGTAAFSEPETQAVRDFFADHEVSTGITFHSYGELVLYPNNGSYDPLDDAVDLQVFELMAEHMAALTGYTDEPGNELYLSAGEMCDWAYHEKGAFAFTIELPTTTFYPGAGVIPEVVAENVQVARFVAGLAGDPYAIISDQPLSVSPNSATIEVGETLQFSARGGVPPYNYSSSNPSVGSINTSGLLVGQAVGTCTVSVLDDDGTLFTTGTITVEEPGQGICGIAGGSDAAAFAALVVMLCGLVLLRKATGA